MKHIAILTCILLLPTLIVAQTNTPWTTNGPIGIGTTITGNAPFTISHDAVSQLRLENNGLGKEAAVRFRSTSANGTYLHADLALVSTAADQGYIGFKVPSNNSVGVGYNMIITHLGFVGIGTATPDSKLTVKGIIHAEEVKLDLTVPGPDYVFEESYPLLSLQETNAYIEENKHLPGIPSSDEMQQSGVNLLEMNMKLLEKVEELTLHLIEMNEQITLQRIEINQLKLKKNEE